MNDSAGHCKVRFCRTESETLERGKFKLKNTQPFKASGFGGNSFVVLCEKGRHIFF